MLSSVSKRRRALSSVLATILSFGYLVVAPQPAAAASYGGCLDQFQAHWFTFTEKGSQTTNIRNVNTNQLTTYSPVDQFRPCHWSSEIYDGSSGWIAIVAGYGNPQSGNPSAILQIGVLACNWYGFLSACVQGQKRYFWAEGGCGLWFPWPQSLGGPVNDSSHNYEIRHRTNHWYYLKIDGVTKVSFLDTSHDAVNCWITDNYTKAQWAFERWDRGDGLGDSSHKARFVYAHLMWGDPGDSGAWAIPNFSGCDHQPTSGRGQSYCDYFSHSLYGWTVY